jgi:hypothetical protein
MTWTKDDGIHHSGDRLDERVENAYPNVEFVEGMPYFHAGIYRLYPPLHHWLLSDLYS